MPRRWLSTTDSESNFKGSQWLCRKSSCLWFSISFKGTGCVGNRLASDSTSVSKGLVVSLIVLSDYDLFGVSVSFTGRLWNLSCLIQRLVSESTLVYLRGVLVLRLKLICLWINVTLIRRSCCRDWLGSEFLRRCLMIFWGAYFSFIVCFDVGCFSLIMKCTRLGLNWEKVALKPHCDY